MTMDNDLNALDLVILGKTSMPDLLKHLAQECCEVAAAILKYVQVLEGTDPTPVSRREAAGNMMDEAADLINYLRVLDWDDKTKLRQYQKTTRWVKRLEEK